MFSYGFLLFVEIPFVIPERFERSTHSLEGCCSIQLSYGTNEAASAEPSQREGSVPLTKANAQIHLRICFRQRYRQSLRELRLCRVASIGRTKSNLFVKPRAEAKLAWIMPRREKVGDQPTTAQKYIVYATQTTPP